MTNYEYHQLLKFLYFEGYADSYENAEYLMEEMNDDEFYGLYESVIINSKIINHLLDEGYADTNEAALVIMENMSEEWREDIVEAILQFQSFKDKRKKVEDKVKELKSQITKDPQDLGFRNARLKRRIAGMKNVLSKSNKEIRKNSELKSYENSARGGFRHFDNPDSRYYAG